MPDTLLGTVRLRNRRGDMSLVGETNKENPNMEPIERIPGTKLSLKGRIGEGFRGLVREA